MKSFFLLFLTYTLNNFSSFAQFGTVATYNIRYDGHTDLANDWVERKVPIAQFILSNQIDIIGFQEVLHNQLLDLHALLPNYKHVGVGRDDGKTQGEYAPIFYDSTKYTAVQSGTFWLSPTPQIPSRGWDAALNRICTYVLLKEINGGDLTWVFNTHFDHIGVEARLHSAELILDQIAEFLQTQNAPVLLIGDFNMEPTDRGIQLIRSSYKDLTCSLRHPELCSASTFNGFTATTSDDKRIDYIFGSAHILPSRHLVDQTNFDRSYPSDHFPVLVVYMVLR